MALSSKYQKEMEAEIHEQLYNNIKILTSEYPTTKEFNACFKKDMFVKTNKSAFQHVTHFLLNILDPTLFKEKIVWPIHDIKMEIQFRNEVMKNLNELNSQYPDTGVPLLMTSHLITPGGYKFAEFMFKLSRFVLSEHVKRDEKFHKIILLAPKSDNYYTASEQLKNINYIVNDQYYQLAQKQFHIEKNFDKALQTSQYIMEEIPIAQQCTQQTFKKANEIFEQDKNTYEVVYQTSDSPDERDKQIDKSLETLEMYNRCINELSELFNTLSQNESILTFKKRASTFEEVSSTTEDIDFLNLVKSFYEMLKINKYIMKNRRNHNLAELLNKTHNIIEDMREYSGKYEEIVPEIQFYLTQHGNRINYIKNEPMFQSSRIENENHTSELFRKIQDIFISISL